MISFYAFHVDAKLDDSVYELVPAAEEMDQETEVNVVQKTEEPEPEYHFE